MRKLKRKRSKKQMHIWTKGLLILVAVLAVALAVFLGIQIVKAPSLSEIDASPEGYLTTILDRDENVTNTLYVTESNRIHVTLDNIPKDLQNAFIAIEDSRFYDHHGIDMKGILRAAVHGVKNGFRFTQGASTLTQQLLKNNVFTDWMSEESFYDRLSRKIQEQYLAIRLEQKYSKEWILENYLNTINLGGGTRGVQVAASYYFGKSVSELSLAEATLIAGITKNPTAYNPLRHPQESIERQRLVLNAMLEQEMISEEQYTAAKAEDVLGALRSSDEDGTKVFSWFEDALLKQVAADLMELSGYSEEEAWDLIYSGGLVIHSTMDAKLQELCETEAVRQERYPEGQEISIVMTDAGTGAVVAIIGSSQPKDASLVYNRATEAVRQPGSTIKVLGEYAAVIDTKQLTLGSVLNDEPYTYSDGTTLRNSYGVYRGMTTLRDAIASSGNIIALKTYQMAGEEKVFEYLQKFGLEHLTEEDRNEALAIGGTYHGVTNLELTAAYNAIANEGQYAEPFFYTKVTDRNGQTILKRGGKTQTVISKEAANLLSSAMETVITEGTGKAAAVNGVTLAGKSGTTNESRDIWFVGFSSDYTLGVWGGHDNNEAQTSGTYVKKLWQSIMKEAHAGRTDAQVMDTEGLVTAEICKKCGNLAVAEFCEETVQGKMTFEEYYIEGTEPTKLCDCHVSVRICEESGKKAGAYCPKNAVSTVGYLKEAAEGTEDVAALLPETMESCDVHLHFWNQWFGGTKEPQEEEGTSQESNQEDTDEQNSHDGESHDEESHEQEKHWWEDIFSGMF